MKTNTGRKQKSIGSTILVLVLALAYVAVKPKIEAWLADKTNDKATTSTDLNLESATNENGLPGGFNLDQLDSGISGNTATSSGKQQTSPEAKSTAKSAGSSTVSKSSSPKPQSSADVLKKVGRAYHSRAGLIYGPGREHRRDHVLRHAKDDLSKPVHGVFDDESSVFALVDEAYEKVKSKSGDVKSSKDRDRMAHIINMRRRIGYKGGRTGKERGNPPLKKIKIILVEGNKVITAFPY